RRTSRIAGRFLQKLQASSSPSRNTSVHPYSDGAASAPLRQPNLLPESANPEKVFAARPGRPFVGRRWPDRKSLPLLDHRTFQSKCPSFSSPRENILHRVSLRTRRAAPPRRRLGHRATRAVLARQCGARNLVLQSTPRATSAQQF